MKVLENQGISCVAGIQAMGNAIVVNNFSNPVVLAEKKGFEDYGCVGTPTRIVSDFLESLLEKREIPVVSCLGVTENGEWLNVNSDEVAFAVAESLHAEKLLVASDVPGILLDKNDSSTLVSELTVAQAKELVEKGIVSGGMVPKILTCIQALETPIKQVHIFDGTRDSLLSEIFSETGRGTRLKKQ